MINFEISEKDQVSNESIADLMEARISDESTVITVKVDLTDDYDYDMRPSWSLIDIRSYLDDCGVNVIALSSGLHLKGKNQKPHLHYHFITEHHLPPTNPSQHRKRWMIKTNRDLSDCSFKYQNIKQNMPRYGILAYPLKEGLYLRPNTSYEWFGEKMTQAMFNFLLEVGQSIYQKEIGLKMRQDKCEERKKVSLNELFELCKTNSSHFHNLKSMLVWLDENYIAKLELDEYPDPKNYKTNCQKICVALGKLKYSEIL